MTIYLEEYTPDKRGKVKDFILHTWKEFGFVYMPEFDQDLDDPKKFYIQPGGMFYILREGDMIIGTIGIIIKGDSCAELKRFYIDTDYRGKGYGTRLFNKAIEFCRQHGMKKVEFETGKAFTQGHTFYINKGFKKVREDKDSYYMEKYI